ncbi:MAG: site-2 protease family protein [Pseudanabaena sp. M158S2SP1A06QC]|jgi:Zn-dependent protease/CBS domain-containing protein|nr:site-2 protease family protein [Pseudanabaena sp. M179S2SP2A07QC]MCA6571727.1 site-2 protease family protein [Pseudanabaena sp. M53BS1SP1A06MG]MCA6581808.1 site-2 protease family protein [Pseudanabaena sp. M34BS1SP1A06MG]MCA6591944.1 site-2 protease family protein [Pseudanabaena sp. M38BS1SP1A06MG]MCA6598457.1 site-2 protease family protein [Pseudanabaena sp. M046S1SP1A06QC]MCA6599436.1 site-2 protease family protein [Pseudanabaena sp. M57BS1SP1A06MG]MCA6611474.1 site-2 protease family pro
MRGGIRIGSIYGISLYIDPSWFLILSILAVLLGNAYAKLSPSFSLGYGAITAILFFLSIALNKIAHGLMAKARGVAINSINIQFMGAANNVERESQDPFSVFSIAISGPLTSLVLSAIGFTVTWLIAGDAILSSNPKLIEALSASIGALRTIWTIISLYFAQINLFIGIFSLIPALPFEGGHILKAAIWKLTGDRFAGIRWAARSGQFFGILIMILGGIILTSNLGGLFLIVLGWFMFGSAGGYLYLNNLQQALLDLNAEAAMTRDFRLVDADISLRDFADKFILMEDKDANPIYVASANGRDRGLVSAEQIRHIDSHEWPSRSLQALVKPFDEIDTVELKDQILKVISLLEQKQLRYVIVRSPVGSVAGVIDRGDIIKALDSKLLWRIPSEYIKQIKADGKFPPNFRLVEICEQLNQNNQ